MTTEWNSVLQHREVDPIAAFSRAEKATMKVVAVRHKFHSILSQLWWSSLVIQLRAAAAAKCPSCWKGCFKSASTRPDLPADFRHDRSVVVKVLGSLMNAVVMLSTWYDKFKNHHDDNRLMWLSSPKIPRFYKSKQNICLWRGLVGTREKEVQIPESRWDSYENAMKLM